MIRRDNRRPVAGAVLNVQRHTTAEHPLSAAPSQYPIENISRGGLRFHSHDDYRIDERIIITVHLANGEIHSAMARICYCNSEQGEQVSYHYGVSFLDNFLEMALCV